MNNYDTTLNNIKNYTAENENVEASNKEKNVSGYNNKNAVSSNQSNAPITDVQHSTQEPLSGEISTNINISVDYKQLQNTVDEILASPEVQTFLGASSKNPITKASYNNYDQEADQVTITETYASGETKSTSGIISDFDIRELMKLLIACFSSITTANRQRTLTLMMSALSALETKIALMTEKANKEYDAKMLSGAISIASGVVSCALSLGGGALSIGGLSKQLKNAKSYANNKTDINQTVSKNNRNLKKEISSTHAPDMAPPSRMSIVGSMLSGLAMSAGKMIEGMGGMIAASIEREAKQAEILMESINKLQEILQKGENASDEDFKTAMQSINKILNFISDLVHRIAQTEQTVARF